MCLSVRVALTPFMRRWRNGRRAGLRLRCPQGRAGSSPALRTHASLAQMAEHLTFNQGAMGSSPIRRTFCTSEETEEHRETFPVFLTISPSMVMLISMESSSRTGGNP